jgi:hypothetical protein
MSQKQVLVMPGLVPGIHGLAPSVPRFVDGRIKSGHDDKVDRMVKSEH